MITKQMMSNVGAVMANNGHEKEIPKSGNQVEIMGYFIMLI